MWASLGEKRNNSLEESPSPHIRGIAVETHKDVKTLSENKLARYIHEKKNTNTDTLTESYQRVTTMIQGMCKCSCR